MKILLTIFLIFPLALPAQNKDTIPFKNANRIIVVTGKSAIENYSVLKMLFTNNGYTIRTINDDSLTVHSAQLSTQSVTTTFSVDGWARENEIILSGSYYSRVDNSISGGSYKIFTNEISNRGGKESASIFTFRLLQQLAQQVGGRLFYEKAKTSKASVL